MLKNIFKVLFYHRTVLIIHRLTACILQIDSLETTNYLLFSDVQARSITIGNEREK